MSIHEKKSDTVTEIPTSAGPLEGFLNVPDPAERMIVFVHGSGSSRHSPRNRSVAATLQRNRCATLLFDLLTEEEGAIDDVTRRLRFDIDFLAGRLQEVLQWISEQDDASRLALGLFGASTGSAAALKTAAAIHGVAALVSRGGRPDLAQEALPSVHCPTLLIVGGNDAPTLEVNRQAMEYMTCTRELKIVQGASHLFEETGKMEEVAELATQWFSTHPT
jgi:dienelactone hydrolase